MSSSPDPSVLLFTMIERIAEKIERTSEIQAHILNRIQTPSKPPTRTAMLPPDAVSEILQVPVKRLAEWRSQEIRPPYHRVGKSIVYDPGDIEKFLSANRVMPKFANAQKAMSRVG
jgi:hypothetical protein